MSIKDLIFLSASLRRNYSYPKYTTRDCRTLVDEIEQRIQLIAAYLTKEKVLNVGNTLHSVVNAQHRINCVD
jgi:hypothetical protein